MAGNISLLSLFFYNKCRRFDLNLNYMRTITQKESRWTSTGTKLHNEPHRSEQPELPFNYEINLPLYQFNRTQNLNSNVINSDNKRAKLHNVKATFPSLTIEPNKLKEIRKCWCTGVHQQKKKNESTREKKGSSRMEEKSTRILSDELPKKIIKFWRIIERNIALVQRQTVPAYINFYLCLFTACALPLCEVRFA